jgi:hypothetical protein
VLLLLSVIIMSFEREPVSSYVEVIGSIEADQLIATAEAIAAGAPTELQKAIGQKVTPRANSETSHVSHALQQRITDQDREIQGLRANAQAAEAELDRLKRKVVDLERSINERDASASLRIVHLNDDIASLTVEIQESKSAIIAQLKSYVEKKFGKQPSRRRSLSRSPLSSSEDLPEEYEESSVAQEILEDWREEDKLARSSMEQEAKVGEGSSAVRVRLPFGSTFSLSPAVTKVVKSTTPVPSQVPVFQPPFGREVRESRQDSSAAAYDFPF